MNTNRWREYHRPNAKFITHRQRRAGLSSWTNLKRWTATKANQQHTLEQWNAETLSEKLSNRFNSWLCVVYRKDLNHKLKKIETNSGRWRNFEVLQTEKFIRYARDDEVVLACDSIGTRQLCGFSAHYRARKWSSLCVPSAACNMRRSDGPLVCQQWCPYGENNLFM